MEYSAWSPYSYMRKNLQLITICTRYRLRARSVRCHGPHYFSDRTVTESTLLARYVSCCWQRPSKYSLMFLSLSLLFLVQSSDTETRMAEKLTSRRLIELIRERGMLHSGVRPEIVHNSALARQPVMLKMCVDDDVCKLTCL